MDKVTVCAVPEIKKDSAIPVSPNNEPRNIVPKRTKHNCTIVADIKYLFFSNTSSFEKRIIPIVAGITVSEII